MISSERKKELQNCLDEGNRLKKNADNLVNATKQSLNFWRNLEGADKKDIAESKQNLLEALETQQHITDLLNKVKSSENQN